MVLADCRFRIEKAKKDHKCSDCGRVIHKGDKRVRGVAAYMYPRHSCVICAANFLKYLKKGLIA